MAGQTRTPTPGASHKPLARGWIHVVGAVALAAASPILVASARTWAQVGWCLCFVVGVEVMLTTSSIFHRGHWSVATRRKLRRADHSAIFVAISGSYGAIIGLTTHGTIRVVVLAVVTLFAAAGVAIRQLAIDAPKWVNTIPYLVVGWVAVGVLPQILRGGGPVCFELVVAGGLAYSVGALFYATKKPALSPRVFGYHELFHVMTLVGISCHFLAILAALHFVGQ